MSFWRKLRLCSQVALLVFAASAASQCETGTSPSAPATERRQSTFNF